MHFLIVAVYVAVCMYLCYNSKLLERRVEKRLIDKNLTTKSLKREFYVSSLTLIAFYSSILIFLMFAKEWGDFYIFVIKSLGLSNLGADTINMVFIVLTFTLYAILFLVLIYYIIYWLIVVSVKVRNKYILKINSGGK